MKFDTVFISAPFEENKDIRADFPFLTFNGKRGAMMNVVNDTSTIDGMGRELRKIHDLLNGECNKMGLALKDVNFKLHWASREIKPHKSTTVRKPIDEEIPRGSLVRIRATGEVLTFDRAEYTCNWRYGVTDNRDVYWGSYNLNELQIVDKLGNITKEWLKDTL